MVDWSLLERSRSASIREAEQLLARLVSGLRPVALSFAFRMLQDQALAEDAVQEAFVRLWGSQARDQQRASIQTYFLTIVRNESLRILSSRKDWNIVEPDDLQSLLDDQIAQETDQTIQVDHNHDLDAALAVMPDRQRTALLLWAYQGLDAPEIGQVLGLSTNAAHQLLHRSKLGLKKQLQVTI